MLSNEERNETILAIVDDMSDTIRGMIEEYPVTWVLTAFLQAVDDYGLDRKYIVDKLQREVKGVNIR